MEDPNSWMDSLGDDEMDDIGIGLWPVEASQPVRNEWDDWQGSGAADDALLESLGIRPVSKSKEQSQLSTGTPQGRSPFTHLLEGNMPNEEQQGKVLKVEKAASLVIQEKGNLVQPPTSVPRYNLPNAPNLVIGENAPQFMMPVPLFMPMPMMPAMMQHQVQQQLPSSATPATGTVSTTQLASSSQPLFDKVKQKLPPSLTSSISTTGVPGAQNPLSSTQAGKQASGSTVPPQMNAMMGANPMVPQMMQWMPMSVPMSVPMPMPVPTMGIGGMGMGMGMAAMPGAMGGMMPMGLPVGMKHSASQNG